MCLPIPVPLSVLGWQNAIALPQCYTRWRHGLLSKLSPLESWISDCNARKATVYQTLDCEGR